MQFSDEIFMHRCFELATLGLGHTFPNPLVGAVVVHNNIVIGEGYHHQAGEPHAEVNAIAAVSDLSLLKNATIYVNLEPCAHFGKTPPCADLIIAHNIPRVVISNVDPFDKVAGKGIERMRKAGIAVETGVLEHIGRKINQRFFTYVEKKRPYVVLKWAQSRDGFMDINRENGERGSFQITGDASKRQVHKWRTEEQSILVGYNTIINDDPQLNARLYAGKNPIKVVIDPKAQLEPNFRFLNNEAPAIIISDEKNRTANRMETYRKYTDLSKDSVQAILDILYSNQIQSVLVEGGAYTLQQFISAGLWDEVRLFTGKVFLQKGMPSPHLSLTPSHSETIGEDQLDIFYA